MRVAFVACQSVDVTSVLTPASLASLGGLQHHICDRWMLMMTSAHEADVSVLSRLSWHLVLLATDYNSDRLSLSCFCINIDLPLRGLDAGLNLDETRFDFLWHELKASVASTT